MISRSSLPDGSPCTASALTRAAVYYGSAVEDDLAPSVAFAEVAERGDRDRGRAARRRPRRARQAAPRAARGGVVRARPRSPARRPRASARRGLTRDRSGGPCLGMLGRITLSLHPGWKE